MQRAFMELTGLPIQVGWGMTEAIWLTIARRPSCARRGFMGSRSIASRYASSDATAPTFPHGEAGEL